MHIGFKILLASIFSTLISLIIGTFVKSASSNLIISLFLPIIFIAFLVGLDNSNGSASRFFVGTGIFFSVLLVALLVFV